jgi:hypothetical protein
MHMGAGGGKLTNCLSAVYLVNQPPLSGQAHAHALVIPQGDGSQPYACDAVAASA